MTAAENWEKGTYVV